MASLFPPARIVAAIAPRRCRRLCDDCPITGRQKTIRPPGQTSPAIPGVPRVVPYLSTRDVYTSRRSTRRPEMKPLGQVLTIGALLLTFAGCDDDNNNPGTINVRVMQD